MNAVPQNGGFYEKSDRNLTVTKLKCMYKKYITYEKLKINSSSEKHKTIYHNGSYLLLFGKRQLLSFETLCE